MLLAGRVGMHLECVLQRDANTQCSALLWLRGCGLYGQPA